MKGNIIGFDPDTNTGAIGGHDGNRYDFVTLDWRGSGRPRRGDLVDFQAIERRATDIFLVEPVYAAPSFAVFYFSVTGRISRAQYWYRFILPYSAIFIPLELAAVFADKEGNTYTVVSGIITLLYLVVLWPSIAVLVKRIHDRNKSGLYILFLILSTITLTSLVFVWIGAAFYQAGESHSINFNGPLGVLGGLAIVSAVVVIGVNIWFFIEFGCLRGTPGANRFGPDPTR
jgi:uncharacterized membrane protein YhaH (DUF805 family)